jgi:hypothetical protein
MNSKTNDTAADEIIAMLEGLKARAIEINKDDVGNACGQYSLLAYGQALEQAQAIKAKHDKRAIATEE